VPALFAALLAALATPGGAWHPGTRVPSCPVANATRCLSGVSPQGTLQPMSVADMLSLQSSIGGSGSQASVGLCLTATLRCNAQMQSLHAINPQLVATFASPCMVNGAVQVSNATFTVYGAFDELECAAVVTGLQLAQADPLRAALVSKAVVEVVVCDTDLCTSAAPEATASAAPGGAVRGRAAAPAALAGAALLALAVLL
jgi:hypothetical protein